MTKQEFLQELRQALGAEVDSYTVQDNVNYYNQYITDEVAGGRTEEDVLNELGDPWLIARTIIDSPVVNSSFTGEYEQSQEESSGYQKPAYDGYGNRQSHVHVFSANAWWKKLLLIVGIAGVIFIIFSIITGIVSLVAPIVVPVLVIMLVIRLLGNSRK